MDKNKVFGGNIAIKVDVGNAFDTLNWGLILKVLSIFYFNKRLCCWVSFIISSAHMFVEIKGSLQGYFKCAREVRQGDHISLFLSHLNEVVLERSISILVSEKNLDMKVTWAIHVPSHTLYADAIFIFYKGIKFLVRSSTIRYQPFFQVLYTNIDWIISFSWLDLQKDIFLLITEGSQFSKVRLKIGICNTLLIKWLQK